MKRILKKITVFSFIFSVCVFGKIFAVPFFSGYSGGKLNYSINPQTDQDISNLKLQAFFAGQFNLNENNWIHLEFSIDTQNLISEDFFTATPSLFQIDELSFTKRFQGIDINNYCSAFMGTYDPIGSDVFLQRYFSIQSITSKLTDSYLGLAGSILYPHFGLGVSDVVKLNQYPLAFGGYLYLNHEDTNAFVLNSDLRAACVYRFFTCDLALGLGLPVKTANQDDYIIAVERLYWHLGTTILIGNNYTNSLFIQGGLFNATFQGKKEFIVKNEDIYILFEPRFIVENFHINISFYSLPPKTIKKMLFIDDSLGFNANFYSDSVKIKSKVFTIGTHLSFSFPDKSIADLSDKKLLQSPYNINLTPYVSTDFLGGELHAQANFRLMEFVNKKNGNIFSIDIGYRTKF